MIARRLARLTADSARPLEETVEIADDEGGREHAAIADPPPDGHDGQPEPS